MHGSSMAEQCPHKTKVAGPIPACARIGFKTGIESPRPGDENADLLGIA